jgi:hypothetical protein
MTPSLICLMHSRYTSYYTIEVDPNQTEVDVNKARTCAEWTVM